MSSQTAWTEIYRFAGISFTWCYLLSFGKLVLNQFTSCWQNISKGAITENYIISLFDSKCIRWWIDLICLQDKHNINEVPLTIKCMCIRRKICERLCEPRLYPSFSRIIHINFIFYHIVYIWIHLELIVRVHYCYFTTIIKHRSTIRRNYVVITQIGQWYIYSIVSTLSYRKGKAWRFVMLKLHRESIIL